MDEQLQHRAKVLAFSLYDAIPQLPDIDQPTEGFERPRYLAGNIEFSVMGGNVSRAISWVEDGVEHQLWFEVRGWVHFTRGDQPNSELYGQRVFDDWPKDDPHPRSDSFEGDIDFFIECANKFNAALGRARRIPAPKEEPTRADPQIDSSRLGDLANMTPNEPMQVVIAIPSGTLTTERYSELAALAYHDIPSLPDGVGGLVALADTNAEVQGYNPRHHGVLESYTVVFRNSVALNLQLADGENSISTLLRDGTVSIEHVKLG